MVKHSECVARLEGVTKTFYGKPVVDGASLELRKGEIALITGESGSGKSTIMRLLSGIEKPDSGLVEVLGNDLSKLSDKKLGKLMAQYVGVGFQAHNLDTNMTVRDNLIGLTEATGKQVDVNRAVDLIKRLDLVGRLQEKASVLSGGQKLRLAFGAVMLARPDVLMLDEPTYALDHNSKQQMFEDIAVACHEDNVSALIVTHDVEPARAIADREYVMQDGRLYETAVA